MNSYTYTSETSPDALAVQLDCLRSMSPQQRLQKALNLTGQIRKMAFDAIRRRHPNLDEGEVHLRFIQMVYGQQLADEVASWKAEKTG